MSHASQASFYGLEGNQQLPVPRITEYVRAIACHWENAKPHDGASALQL